MMGLSKGLAGGDVHGGRHGRRRRRRSASASRRARCRRRAGETASSMSRIRPASETDPNATGHTAVAVDSPDGSRSRRAAPRGWRSTRRRRGRTSSRRSRRRGRGRGRRRGGGREAPLLAPTVAAVVPVLGRGGGGGDVAAPAQAVAFLGGRGGVVPIATRHVDAGASHHHHRSWEGRRRREEEEGGRRRGLGLGTWGGGFRGWGRMDATWRGGDTCQGTAGGAWCARRRAVWLRASLPWFSPSPSPVWPAPAAATSPPNYQTNQKSPIL